MTHRIVGALALLAMIAALSPTVGAIVDHHLQERMPGHGHVYYGRPDLRHTHGYEVRHPEVPRTNVRGAPVSFRSVVILSADSAAKDAPVAAVALGFTVGDSEIAPIRPSMSLISPLPDSRPGSVFLAPPEIPPRQRS